MLVSVGVRAVNEEAGIESEVVEAVDYLVSLGADVNTIDDNQETADFMPGGVLIFLTANRWVRAA